MKPFITVYYNSDGCESDNVPVLEDHVNEETMKSHAEKVLEGNHDIKEVFIGRIEGVLRPARVVKRFGL